MQVTFRDPVDVNVIRAGVIFESLQSSVGEAAIAKLSTLASIARLRKAIITASVRHHYQYQYQYLSVQRHQMLEVIK